MKMTCIVCPMGCQLKVTTDQGLQVTGQQCPRGLKYAEDEVTAPKRVYTGNLPCQAGKLPVISYKTNLMLKQDLPKLQTIAKQLVIEAPVQLGDILYQDEAFSMIATRTIERK